MILPRELAPHRMLPVFIVNETTDLLKSVAREAREMLGEDELPEDLIRGLLAQQRLLIIVDVSRNEGQKHSIMLRPSLRMQRHSIR